MIPKIIHYCWFGKGLMPASQKEFIKGWQKLMPDYELKCWNESNFDINCNAYVQHAYNRKKFAFVSDYARLKVLYTEGGFYLDTDVEVYASFDNLRNNSFVSAVEYFPEFEEHKYLLDEQLLPKEKGIIIPCLGFLSAFIGSEEDNNLLKDTLDFYDSITPEHPDYNGIVIDGIMAREALKYGFKYSDSLQELPDNMLIYPSSLFCSMKSQLTNNSYLIHHCAQSWQPKTKNQILQLQLDKYHLLKFYKFLTGMKKKIVNH